MTYETGATAITTEYGSEQAVAVLSEPAHVLCGCGRYVDAMSDAQTYACACGRVWRVTVNVQEVNEE